MSKSAILSTIMTSAEIRQRYLKFFEKRGHKIIPSASLVPEKYDIPDKGTLFTSAGMQPLIPYLLGKTHPAGTRLVDVQKCVLTGDIEDVGDNRHCTFFEMMGNCLLIFMAICINQADILVPILYLYLLSIAALIVS